MSNPAARKGNQEGEIPAENHLIARGFHRVYRLGRQGSKDKGDIGGIDDVCIEVKNRARYDLPGWMRELAAEKKNKAARIGALIVKPKGVGKTRVDQWWVVMTMGDFEQLLIDGGYGPYRDPVEGEQNVGVR